MWDKIKRIFLKTMLLLAGLNLLMTSTILGLHRWNFQVLSDADYLKWTGGGTSALAWFMIMLYFDFKSDIVEAFKETFEQDKKILDSQEDQDLGYKYFCKCPDCDVELKLLNPEKPCPKCDAKLVPLIS